MAEFIESTANLQIRKTPKKGRGVFVNVAARKGSRFISEDPLFWVVSTARINDLCHACCSNGTSLLKCSKCKFARYCNKLCQRSGWSDHKLECEILSTCQQTPPDTIRLLSRIILRDQNAAKRRAVATAMSAFSVFPTCVDELCSHMDNMKEDAQLQLAEGTTLLKILLGSLIEHWSVSDLMEIIAKVRCNSFTICTGELQPIGLGMYPMAAMFNHSCEANCVPTFDGLKISIRALKDINEDDELTISYVDLMSTAKERAQQLMSQYCFQCDCSKCFIVTDTQIVDDDDDAAEIASSTLTLLQTMRKDGKSGLNILSKCQPVLKDLQCKISSTDINMMKMLDIAMDAAINNQLWEEALQYGLQSLESYREYFPEVHPCLGLQMFRVGKLHLYLEHISEAHVLLKQAERILEITHGRQHSLVDDLITQLHHCEEELRHRRLMRTENRALLL